MDRLPLLTAGVCAAAGAFLTHRSGPAVTTAASALAVLGLARFRLIAAAALAAGALASVFSAGHGPSHLRERTMRFACTFLDHERCITDAGATLEVFSGKPLPAPATRCLLRGRIEGFGGPRNPGEPDPSALARERGVDARVAQANVIAMLSAQAHEPLAVTIARWQSRARAILAARIPEPQLSVLAGALWGEKSALPPALKHEFQETGTVHVLVTAGLHVGVIVLLVLSTLKALRAPRLCVAAVAVCAVWAYAVFSGAHLPSVRAAVMATFGIAAYAAGAAPLSWNGYGAALLVVSLLRPESVGGASFDLSFSCVGSILLLGGRIERALEAFEMPARVREALTLSAATQIGTWPLTASVFLLFAPYAVAANLLVVPFVGFAMLAAVAQIVLHAAPPLADLAGTIDNALLGWIVDVVSVFASFPGAAVPVVPPPAPLVAAYDCALAGTAFLWDGRGRTFGAALVLVATLAIALPVPRRDGRLRITVLDVGQADGIVIETPAGHVILVDAGGRLERGAVGTQSAAEQVGERVVVPFLRREGIEHIDAVVLSHPHGDHAGGIAPVLRNFGGAGIFADGGQRYGGYAYRDALAVAGGERIAIVNPRAGEVWRYADGVTLTFIGPSLPFIQSDNTINDNSVAFILQYKHFRMLFTGDAGVAAEQRFLNEGIDLHADVLKVGHHGSAYSSSEAFIAAVHPRYAVISVGLHNMFGHPAPSTIATLERFGARIYRTDRNGAVVVTSDGYSGVRISETLP